MGGADAEGAPLEAAHAKTLDVPGIAGVKRTKAAAAAVRVTVPGRWRTVPRGVTGGVVPCQISVERRVASSTRYSNAEFDETSVRVTNI